MRDFSAIFGNCAIFLWYASSGDCRISSKPGGSSSPLTGDTVQNFPKHKKRLDELCEKNEQVNEAVKVLDDHIFFMDKFDRPVDERSLDWLIDRLIDRLIDWLIDWLINWLIDWIVWVIDWLVDCLIDLVDWLIDWLPLRNARMRQTTGNSACATSWACPCREFWNIICCWRSWRSSRLPFPWKTRLHWIERSWLWRMLPCISTKSNGIVKWLTRLSAWRSASRICTCRRTCKSLFYLWRHHM